MTRTQMEKQIAEAKKELEKVQEEIASIEEANIWNDEIDETYQNLNDKEGELEYNIHKGIWLKWNAAQIFKAGGTRTGGNNIR